MNVDSSHMCLVSLVQDEWAGFDHMIVRVMDKPGQDLLSYLDITHEFIEEGRRSGGGVLVHCMAGISRSATCLLAYIMRAEGLPLNQALELLQAKRCDLAIDVCMAGRV